ncbi:MAG TPA: GNAT family N-acetyltransferase [Streptosporangiaceae bacterium]|jgi:GNAT superfamily N-acetyltransferase|nr:GNAT family N-acetyltransferase [Streptosporangiaceae bacterium]
MPVTIREATATDIDGLVASNSALFAVDAAVREPLRNSGWPQAHAAGHVTETLANPDMLVLVAEHDGAVIGHLTGVFLPVSAMWTAPRAELFSMQVMAPWRGQGIGSQLVDRFKTWAHARGAAQLRVCAYTANEAAIHFYRRHGFAPLDTTLALDL